MIVTARPWLSLCACHLLATLALIPGVTLAAASAKAPVSSAPVVANSVLPARSPISPAQLRGVFEQQSKTYWQLPPEEQKAYAERLQLALREGVPQRSGQASVPAEWPSQYILLVDRNPHVQTLFIYWKPAHGPWEFVWAAPVSTGRTGRFDHYLTPRGVFVHELANPDYRAEGTRNQHGVRGYGSKGMRVFDFGWANSERGWGKGEVGTIRLQMHATDPSLLESRLGQRASKGCVRISSELNRLIDHYGLIDADYEAASQAGQRLWVLRKDREPVSTPGRYLVVIDSGQTEKPAWRASLTQPPATSKPTDKTASK